MNIAVKEIEPRVLDVQVSEDEISAFLVDGRRISVPLAWSWRLSEATPEQRQNFQVIGEGEGFTGPMLTKISASKECWAVSRQESLRKLLAMLHNVSASAID
jgi:hypothetical protein